MDIHLKVIGILLMLLAAVHIGFPKYFHWKKELSALSLINKQMMQVHTFFIAFTVFLMGLLSFAAGYDLQHTVLGKQICIGLSVFWAIRLFIQLFVYSSKLWKGKTFETGMHVFFTLLWIYLVMVFGIIGFGHE